MSYRAVVLGLTLGAASACTISLPNGGEVANGIDSQLSFDIDGAVAAGSPFKIKVWAPTPNRRCYGLLGCADRAPMSSATLNCADGATCEQTDKEPNETENYECTFIMQAGAPGMTEVVAEVMTADGEVRRDRIAINVVDATDVRVDCASCGEGGELASGESHQVTCVPMNPAIQDTPLRGDCEVAADGSGIVVQPAGNDADFYLDTMRGTAANEFSVRIGDQRAGTVIFRSGDVERRLGITSTPRLR